jgi:NAD(P)-dependent dehydrogenase (short-subunit alcohol dehydrogenase family)
MPGSTLSDGARRFLDEQAARENKTSEQVASDFFQETRTSSLIERFLSPTEIALAVAYLASPISSATNGSVIKADGGSVTGIF